MTAQFVRCPQCRTTFRVTPPQLALRDGLVRCGRCRLVFNAFTALVDFKGARVPGPGMEGAPSETMTLRDFVLAKESEFTVVAKPVSVVLPPTPAAPEPQITRILTATPPAGAGDDSGESDDAGDEDASASEKKRRRKKRRRKDTVSPLTLVLDTEKPSIWKRLHLPGWCRPLFYLLTLPGLAVLLAAQTTLRYHDELAADHPQLAPALTQGCRWLGCAVRPPRNLEALAIEASDLQADPNNPQQLLLSATLRNRGSRLVAYPTLRLELIDGQDRVRGRRYFSPDDYLLQPADVNRGLPATSDLSLRLLLRSTLDLASGYRLSIVYP